MKKIISVSALIVASMMLGACGPQSQDPVTEQETAANNTPDELNTLDERFSYAYGVELAEKFKAEGIDLNVDLMAAGMNDAFQGSELRIPAEEVSVTTREFEKRHFEKKEAERAILAEKNKKEGEAFLTENAKKEGVIVTESGLQYKIIKEGTGDYKPAEFDEVTVQYRGTFVDGTEFDNSYKRNKPHVAIVKQLIDGWVEALQMMTEGAVWELYIPAHLAYGEAGSGEWVGPNAALIFEVELLGVEKETETEIETETETPE